jgi:hypothetical protein
MGENSRPNNISGPRTLTQENMYNTPTDAFKPIRADPPGAPMAPRRSLRREMEEHHAEMMLRLSSPPKRLKSRMDVLAHRRHVFDFLIETIPALDEWFANVLPLYFSVIVVFGNVTNGTGDRLWTMISRGQMDGLFEGRSPLRTIFYELAVVWSPIMRNYQACLRMAMENETNLNRHHMHMTTRPEKSVVNSIQPAYDLVNRGPLTRFITANMTQFAHPFSDTEIKFDTSISCCGFFDASEVWDDCIHADFEIDPSDEDPAMIKIFHSLFECLMVQVLDTSVTTAMHNPKQHRWQVVGGERIPPWHPPASVTRTHDFYVHGLRVALRRYYDPSQYYFYEYEPQRGSRVQKYNMSVKIVGVLFLLHAFFRSRFRFLPSEVMVNSFSNFTCGFFSQLWSGNFEAIPNRILPRFPLALHAYIFGTSCLPRDCISMQNNFRGVYTSRLGIVMYERYFLTDYCAGLIWMLTTIHAMIEHTSEFFHVNMDEEGTWFELDDKDHYLMTTVCFANFLALLRLFFRSVFDPKEVVVGPERVSGINIDDFTRGRNTLGVLRNESFQDQYLQRALIKILRLFISLGKKSKTGKFYFPNVFPVFPTRTRTFEASSTVFGVMNDYIKSGMAKSEVPQEPRVIDISLQSILENLNNRCYKKELWRQHCTNTLKFDINQGLFQTGRWSRPGFCKPNFDYDVQLETLFEEFFSLVYEGEWGAGVVEE